MKLFILLIFISIQYCSSLDLNNIKFYGETDYTQKENKSLRSSINMDYRIHIYEPSHKKWVLYINGVITPDYDHFGKELKVNTFTTLGIDF
jgi:hypothetical protein